SGAEHQLSHLWEMRGLSSKGEEISHGFKVGIGTIMVSCLYEYLLAQDMSELDVAARCRGWPGLAAWEAEVGRTHPEAAIRRQALAETRAKYVTAEQLGLRLERLKAAWPALRARLRAQLLPPDEVRRLLGAAGCPTEPGQIGLTPEEVRASFGAARQIRRRYTVLDLAAETGHLAPALEALFGRGGAGASR
ncbi:MAG TPA: sn-glycerol-1-phosphate dehydrogenase, partial [Chloroflexota bacterium]|nr:sn-glycerol-1-phosphate dehydrogenase [Chloroflexota bacterium]